MMRIIFLFSALFLFIAAMTMSVVAEQPADSTFLTPRQYDEQFIGGEYLRYAPPPPPSIASPQYQSGDTVTILCDIENYSFGTFGGTDCWGWRDNDGTEYAIMGIDVGVAFVNTSTKTVADIVIGPQSSCGSARWRDMVTYQNYCYCVSECSGTNSGLMVIDMKYLPDSVHFIGSFQVSNSGQLTSHNLAIDTATGYAYAQGGSSANTAVRILSLANPENPVYVGSFGPSGGVHDMYARNDTVYLAEGFNPYFSIWDLSNKNAPQQLARINIPSAGYVHNIWPSGDGNYVVTTEETSFKTVKIWDIQDLGNVQLVGQYLGSSGLAHNAQVQGDTIFISHYESGISIVDMSNASAPAEIGVFNAYPTDNPDYAGALGVYPHTVSGNIYASNLDGQLFVIQYDNVILADTMWVDSVIGSAGSQVKVDIVASNSLPIYQFVVPIQYAGPYNLTLDSVSTAGLRTAYFEELTTIASDPNNKRKAYALTSSSVGTSPPLEPGKGPILSLYFTIPFGASGTLNSITLSSFNNNDVTFGQECIAYTPDTINGAVLLGSPCCMDNRGNVDNDLNDEINVADLTYLVDYLFSGGPIPPCGAEGNVNGDANEFILVDDLTYLTDYLFNGGPPPPSCP